MRMRLSRSVFSILAVLGCGCASEDGDVADSGVLTATTGVLPGSTGADDNGGDGSTSPSNADEGSTGDGDGSTAAADDAGGNTVEALDACIAIMDVWWDVLICGPEKKGAAYCFDTEGGIAFTAGQRLDLCTLLTDTYAIPAVVEQAVVDQCLADLLTAECWAWADGLTCENPMCSQACDSIRVIEFCHEASSETCLPAAFQNC